MSKALARIFVPLTKVDVEQRLVYGTISQEVMDKSGEMMDYETSKPLFEKWSGDIEKSTDGKSKGNVRVMHGLNACGKLTELNFDDVAKTIDVAAKIVDDDEWNKVTEGVYTGFSVGGKYAKKWSEKQEDGSTIKKYTADPLEVSIVDNPCVPTATFSMMKADGAIEEVEFQVEHDPTEWPLIETLAKAAPAEEPRTAAESAIIGDPSLTGYTPPNDEVAAAATEMAKATEGKTEEDWGEFVEAARAELIKQHNPLKEDPQAIVPSTPKVKAPDKTKTLEGEGVGDLPGITVVPGEIAQSTNNKTTPAGIRQLWTASDGTGFEKKADCEAHEAELAKAAEEGNEAETEAEQAPVPLADQLKQALSKVATTLAEAEAARAQEAGDEELTVLTDLDRLSKTIAFIEQDAEEVLAKSIYTVSRFADVLSSMANLVNSVKNHSDAEPPLADEVKAAVTALSSTFQTFATEQVAKLVANLDDPKCEYYYCAAKEESADALAKDVAELLDAVKEPADLIKATVTAAIDPAPTGDENSEVEPDDLQKVTAERDDLAKAAQEAVEQIPILMKRIETLENTPNPRAPRNIIEKDGGNGLLKGTTDQERLAEVADLVNTLGPDRLATMMIKASQASGGHRLNPVG